MEAGHKKDGAVFTFTAILNSRVHVGELRKLMENEYLGGDMVRVRCRLKYDEQLRKAYPNLVPPISKELAADRDTKRLDAVQSSIAEMRKTLATLTVRVSELRQLVIAPVGSASPSTSALCRATTTALSGATGTHGIASSRHVERASITRTTASSSKRQLLERGEVRRHEQRGQQRVEREALRVPLLKGVQ